MSQRARSGGHAVGEGGRREPQRRSSHGGSAGESSSFFFVGGNSSSSVRGGASVLPPFPLAPPQYGGNVGLSGPEASMELGRKLKTEGNDLFKSGNYMDSLTKYNQAMKIFQTCAAFLSTDSEMVLTYSNISAAHCKLQQYDRAVEMASRCVSLDSDYAKGYFRRAEGYKLMAQGARDKGVDSRSRKDLFMQAVKDYSRCYRKMTESKEIGMRLKMYYEAMVLSVEYGCTSLLPSVYEFDKATICGRLLSFIVLNLPSSLAKQCLEFLIFSSPRLPKSGLAVVLPIDASSINVSQLLEKHLLTPSILSTLAEKGEMPVTHRDIDQAVELIPDNQADLFKELVKQWKKSGGRGLDYGRLLNISIDMMKSKFAQYLVTCGAVPSKSAILKVTEFPIPALGLLKDMAKKATATTRAELVMRGFIVNRNELVTVALDSGPIDGKAIDMTTIMNSYILCANTDYIKKLIDGGVRPGAINSASTPIYSAIHSKILTPVQQVDVICTLIEGGESISHLCTVFQEENMSPVHAATKLLINTSIARVLELTCARYHFPPEGRLVNRLNQTPYHLLMAAQLNEAVIQGFHILSKYRVDPNVKDVSGRKAESYAPSDLNDPRPRLLRKANPRNAVTHAAQDNDDGFISNSNIAKADHVITLEYLARGKEHHANASHYFKCGEYQNAIQEYRKANTVFESVTEHHTYMKLDINDDWKTLLFNLSIAHRKVGNVDASIDTAGRLIDFGLDIHEGFYCRAEAFAEKGRKRQSDDPEVSVVSYRSAVRDYATCYLRMKDKTMSVRRLEIFSKCFVLAVDYDRVANIPDVFDQDRSNVCSFIVDFLLDSELPTNSKNLAPYLNFLLLSSQDSPKSGLAVRNPCNTSKISIQTLIPDLSEDLLLALLRCGTMANLSDVDVGVQKLKNNQEPLFKIIVDRCIECSKGNKINWNSVCENALKLGKTAFVTLLLNYGATPHPKDVLSVVDAKKMDPKLGGYVAQSSSVQARTQLLKEALSSTNTDIAKVAMESGEIDIQSIDLSDCITSHAVVRNVNLLRSLLKAGVEPNGTRGDTVQLVLKSKSIPREIQAQVVGVLLEWGADVVQVCSAYEEQMSPIHAATKLALETDNPQLLDAACALYQFPAGGRLVDKQDQTPFHLALRAKHKESSIQVCAVLSKYNIDPQVRDRWNKRADEYGRAKADKRVPYLFQRIEDAAKKEESESREGENATSSKPKKKRKKKKTKAKAEDITAEDSQPSEEQPIIEKPAVVSVPDTQQVNLSTLLQNIFKQAPDYFQPSALSVATASSVPSENLNEAAHKFNEETLVISEEMAELLQRGEGVLVKSKELDELPWEVECTERVIKFLKNKDFPRRLQDVVVRNILLLACGVWPTSLLMLAEGQLLKLYEVKLSKSVSIIWEVAVQFSPQCTYMVTTSDSTQRTVHVYSEVIRIWEIVFNPDLRTFYIDNIRKSHDRGLHADVQLQLVPQSDHHQRANEQKRCFPNRFILQKDDSSHGNSTHTLQKFVPAASIREDEFNIVTFYSLTSSVMNSMLNGEEPRRDLPFKEWPKEHMIINLPSNKEAILLLGRSGTGKTTCCLYRLWNTFRRYWERAMDIGQWYRWSPLSLTPFTELKPSITDVDEGKAYPDYEDEADVAADGEADDENQHGRLEHLHQVFISKNYVLCAQMKKKFYDLVAAHSKFSGHMRFETAPPPSKLDYVDDHAFPLFLTSRQFLLLLDYSLDIGRPFFPYKEDGSLAVKVHSSDYDHENPDTLLDLDDIDSDVDEDEDQLGENIATQPGGQKQSIHVWTEVTASYFVEVIWPRIRYHCSDKNTDPLLVWMEIKSFIKGSVQAVESRDGYLSQEEYEALGRKMAANFVGNREEVYGMFLLYQEYLQKERTQNLFDECELVHSIYQRLLRLQVDPLWSIHQFYIDEVQDFTQAELSIFLKCCREPNSLFLTGDTAQSIMRGISFRFGDLRSLFYYTRQRALLSKPPVRISVPKIHELTVNFRSHSGILHLAGSVINLLKEFFPTSFDRLPDDKGMFPGPKPVLLHSCQVSDLALLLQSNKREASAIEFGAHQVIIVQTDEAKKSIPEVLKAGIVLTVFEAKGLEFDDVLLYNFFKDSPVEKEWRVVTSYAHKYPICTTHQVDVLESQPRPLEFEERAHKSLNSELKYLYTAITRTKCNLWVYDASETKRLPMFDYWVRRGLVKVVRMGEKEEDDRVLFTATSTPQQWQHQGDYFKRKGLWEPAIKCYQKAGATLMEKEAEAYLFAQRGRNAQSTREMQHLFEKAAEAFLLCDHTQHNIRYISNAARCLKTAKKSSEAAKLFEKLGKRDMAMRGFLRAKDYENIARIKQSMGDYSGAVRTYSQANKRLEALHLADKCVREGHQLDADVCIPQLASQYAKFYAHRRDEHHLRKVIMYVPDAVLKATYLKLAELYEEAVDVYYKADLVNEANRLASAQELYDTAIAWAKKKEKKAMVDMFVLEKVAAQIYHKRDLEDDLKVLLEQLTKSETLPIKALACLLFGRAFNNIGMCRQALDLYRKVNTVGQLESFHQMVRMKKDHVLVEIVEYCALANDLATSFRNSPKSASHAKILQQAQEFYHLYREEGVYLSPRVQDIWMPGCLRTAYCRDRMYDENGMMRLQPEKVHQILADHFGAIWKTWLNETELESKIQNRIESHSFHQDIITSSYIKQSTGSYPPEQLKLYLEMLELALSVKQFNPRSFMECRFQELPVKLLSSQATMSLPFGMQHKTVLNKSKAISKQLKNNADRIVQDLKNASVDDLYSSWQGYCIAEGHADRMMKTLEQFAIKHGPLEPKYSGYSLVQGKKINNVQIHHHYFWFWLRACSIISKEHVVLPAVKCTYHFLQIIARRKNLRESFSVANTIDIVSLCTTALVSLLNLANPGQHLLLPATYQHTVQVFDLLNAMPDDKSTWFMSACLEQLNRKFRMKQVDKMQLEVVEYLLKFLDLLIGRTNERCHILSEALSLSSESIANGFVVHCLCLCLTMVGNLLVVDMKHFNDLSAVLADICDQLYTHISNEKKTVSGNTVALLPSYLRDAYMSVSSADCVAKLFMAVQHLLKACKYPSNLCCAVSNETSWGVVFKDVSIPTPLFKLKFEALTPYVKPLPPPLPLPQVKPKPAQKPSTLPIKAATSEHQTHPSSPLPPHPSPKPPSQAPNKSPPRASPILPSHPPPPSPPQPLPQVPHHQPPPSLPAQPSPPQPLPHVLPQQSPPSLHAQPPPPQSLPQVHHQPPPPLHAQPPPPQPLPQVRHQPPPPHPLPRLPPQPAPQPPLFQPLHRPSPHLASQAPHLPSQPLPHMPPQQTSQPPFHPQQVGGFSGYPYHFTGGFDHSPYQVHPDPFSVPFIDPTYTPSFSYSSLGVPHTMDGIPQEWEDELAGIEFDEEVEQMLTQPEPEEFAFQSDFSKPPTSEDSTLIDELYCKVCDVELEVAETAATTERNREMMHLKMLRGSGQTFQQHILLPSHRQNLQAFRNYNLSKSLHYDQLVADINSVLDDADLLDDVNIETMVAQCRSFLRSSDQKLAELTNKQLWKEAQSYIEMNSHSFRLQLKQIQTEYEQRCSVLSAHTTKFSKAEEDEQRQELEDEEAIDFDNVGTERKKDKWKKKRDKRR